MKILQTFFIVGAALVTLSAARADDKQEQKPQARGGPGRGRVTTAQQQVAVTDRRYAGRVQPYYHMHYERDVDRDRDHHSRDWWNRYHSHDRYIFLDGDYIANPYFDDYYGYDYYVPRRYYYDEPVYYAAPRDSVLVDVQRKLARKGYYDGAIDGLYGPATRGAVAAFQREHGARGTGRIDDATLEALGLR